MLRLSGRLVTILAWKQNLQRENEIKDNEIRRLRAKLKQVQDELEAQKTRKMNVVLFNQESHVTNLGYCQWDDVPGRVIFLFYSNQGSDDFVFSRNQI